MKHKQHSWRWVILPLIVVLLALTPGGSKAQCSICTRTASQLGEEPAKGLNLGIIYLGLTPFAIIGYIGYRWWKDNKGE